MIHWVLDEVEINKRLFVTREGVTIGTFGTEIICGMYHFPTTKFEYNAKLWSIILRSNVRGIQINCPKQLKIGCKMLIS